MKATPGFNNRVVAALFAVLLGAGPALAVDAAKVDDLLTRLAASADAAEAGRIEAELLIEWSKSGSASIDLLFSRAQDALAMGDAPAAIEHLTAAIDHAPDFLMAYDIRSTAYYMAGEIGPALADIAFVLSREPRQFEAMSGLAILLEETGKKEAALKAYQAVAKVHPFRAEVNDAIARLEKELEGQEL